MKKLNYIMMAPGAVVGSYYIYNYATIEFWYSIALFLIILMFARGFVKEIFD